MVIASGSSSASPPPATNALLCSTSTKPGASSTSSDAGPCLPETGWAFAVGEAKGKGWSKARDAWEGNAVLAGERRDAVQQLCFGSDLPLGDLLTEDAQALALMLHGPLLERRQEVKG